MENGTENKPIKCNHILGYSAEWEQLIYLDYKDKPASLGKWHFDEIFKYCPQCGLKL